MGLRENYDNLNFKIVSEMGPWVHILEQVMIYRRIRVLGPTVILLLLSYCSK